jgi:hypothetical protein
MEWYKLNGLGENLNTWLPQLRRILGVKAKKDKRASLLAKKIIVAGYDNFFFE